MTAAAVELRALKPLTYNRQAVQAGETFTASPTHARLLVLGKRAVLVTSGTSTPEAPAPPVPAPELEPPATPPELEPDPVPEDEPDTEPATPPESTPLEEGRRLILPTRAAAAAAPGRRPAKRPGR